jgi:hypothetical protein
MSNYKTLIIPNIEMYSTRKITEMLWLIDNEISYFDKVNRGKVLSISQKFEREDMAKYSKKLFEEIQKRRYK